MPIKAGNITVLAHKVAVTTATPAPVVEAPAPKIEAPAPKPIQRSAPEPVVETPTTVATDEPVLIVNGKQKRVSKRSAYMLDMLTLDDQ